MEKLNLLNSQTIASSPNHVRNCYKFNNYHYSLGVFNRLLVRSRKKLGKNRKD